MGTARLGCFHLWGWLALPGPPAQADGLGKPGAHALLEKRP